MLQVEVACAFSHASSNQWLVYWCVRMESYASNGKDCSTFHTASFRVRLHPSLKEPPILVSPPYYEIVTFSVCSNISICGMLVMDIFEQHFNGLWNVTCNFCMLRQVKSVLFVYKSVDNEQI